MVIIPVCTIVILWIIAENWLIKQFWGNICSPLEQCRSILVTGMDLLDLPTTVAASHFPLVNSRTTWLQQKNRSGAPFIITVAPFVSTVLHHSSAQFCTICQFSQFQHSLACDLHHVIMIFCINEQSCYRCEYTLSTPYLHHEILLLATAAYRTFRPTCQRIYSTIEI